MGRMGHGYGSECHLLRYLGRHRHQLDQKVLQTLHGDAIDWLDFHFDRRANLPIGSWPDVELKGVEFLGPNHPVQAKWKKYWPQTGNVMNWDAIGLARIQENHEWILVEAKAHEGEIQSDCGARNRGLSQITAIMAQTKKALNVNPNRNWLAGYYQYCNRIALLHFLGSNGVSAHLLHIYFCGNMVKGKRVGPQNIQGWHQALATQEKHVGLPQQHLLSNHIHRLFLPVA